MRGCLEGAFSVESKGVGAMEGVFSVERGYGL